MAGKRIKVYLEVADKKTFAVALDWPGWARSGKTGDEALAALAEYAPRYRKVIRSTDYSIPEGEPTFTVVEKVKGNATTEFGAPAAFVDADGKRVTQADAERTAALVRACWRAVDKQAKKSPSALRKGPRGGGRDRDKMLDHLVSTEAAYARKVGVKHKAPDFDDAKAIKAMREDILDVIGNRSNGKKPVGKGWPVAYTARRIAWHATDHAWEMEDRSSPKKRS
ncbi:hypothetical protein SAMN05443575_1751 [Jatrophihabitans endophyticus]|uniref:Uncharacterized protein n=1 Tax=Jatrophihabitans endophyticus TaxID=1206085 RepID=A0A1M5I4A4_9ACTN|nr:hypothetical protein [Jatrophihabitans endophyticus]SHG23164.1 hypothetical protein SAMN05443575_1751 [Jatrophihabitans endophyticus]